MVDSTARNRAAVSDALDTERAGSIRVRVFEHNEVLRRGFVESLGEDPALHITAASVDAPSSEEIDVAVVSGIAAYVYRLRCPVVICQTSSEGSVRTAPAGNVAAVLPGSTLTGARLRATVHAAAAGLLVVAGGDGDDWDPPLEPRSKLVLEMLAGGYGTREIALRMSYSERTVKRLITGLHDRFRARTRAQVVAQAIRAGLI